MRHSSSSLYLRFMLVFSLSSAVTSSASIKASSYSSSSQKSCAADLLSLLGSKDQASRLNNKEVEKFKSCLKFLVPFSPINKTKSQNYSIQRRRDLLDDDNGRGSSMKVLSYGIENELIWWPPAPVLELARIAVDSGGDPGAIHRVLDPTMLPVPDIEGSNEKRCELTRTPYGRRFISEELNTYLAFLFELIVARGPSVGLHVTLDRYDFFHGHLFLDYDSGRLGILFHAKEYPAYDKDVFPCNMGYCQRGSNVVYDDSMNLRNILWLAPLPSYSTKDWLAPGVLVVLDAHPGGIIYEDLIPEYVRFARTVYEEYLGDVVVDVNYLNVGSKVADYRIFIC